MLRYLLTHLPNIRGKQRLLSSLDSLLGPAAFRCPAGVQIVGFASSTQDNVFLANKSTNAILDHAIAELPADALFIDCGANCGFYSALAARRLGPHGRVFSIEPSAREYDRLLWAIANNAHKCKWVPFNFALGDAPRIVEIDLAAGHTGMNKICDRLSSSRHMQNTPLWTLDDLLSSFAPGSTVDLMKIDVEGFEMAVLQGGIESLQKHCVKKLVVEVTDRFLKTYGHSKDEMYCFLRDLGYKSAVNSDQWQYDELFAI